MSQCQQCDDMTPSDWPPRIGPPPIGLIEGNRLSGTKVGCVPVSADQRLREGGLSRGGRWMGSVRVLLCVHEADFIEVGDAGGGFGAAESELYDGSG